ncbi:hypothetical protein KIPB_000881 [Kipferlia bialata]|uniref:Uncharacterized protein n=1 Tax=Kipferlia bialata TaxID=797122 RepID=A0A9K3CMZ3_9EUKA|nr:hypothetical protein KIPB_000881 [Kipferlia bialata]|eukprot:g881.t1
MVYLLDIPGVRYHNDQSSRQGPMGQQQQPMQNAGPPSLYGTAKQHQGVGVMNQQNGGAVPLMFQPKAERERERERQSQRVSPGVLGERARERELDGAGGSPVKLGKGGFLVGTGSNAPSAAPHRSASTSPTMAKRPYQAQGTYTPYPGTQGIASPPNVAKKHTDATGPPAPAAKRTPLLKKRERERETVLDVSGEGTVLYSSDQERQKLKEREETLYNDWLPFLYEGIGLGKPSKGIQKPVAYKGEGERAKADSAVRVSDTADTNAE